MHLDTEHCVRAVQSKDQRFDGWFFTAVVTTRIYCRPSCPVHAPKAENMRFYPSAAAAQQAGFRACKRCRPDASPGSPAWNQRSDLAARAMRLVADGLVDREGVAGLARHLGYSVRQIERQLVVELGAGPGALARAQRAQSARVLIETTSLSMTDVAFAAGFSSLRTFNDTVRAVFALTPSALRLRSRSCGRTSAVAEPAPATLSLRLPFRPPLCPENLFGHLVATAVPGIEEWRDSAYRRSLRLPYGYGVAGLRPHHDHVGLHLALTDLRDLASAINRCRQLLDLDADPVAIDGLLRTDVALAPLVDSSPGRRVPRTVDVEELALRAVLGQQVSTRAARTHAGWLVRTHGERISDAGGALSHLFPDAATLAAMDPATLPLPRSRAVAFIRLAEALADGDIDLGAGSDWQQARQGLARLAGVGPWTIETIALRALGDPDAFTPTDLGVRLAARNLGLASTPAALTRRAEAWRPWRAYAVQHLWATTDHAVARLPA